MNKLAVVAAFLALTSCATHIDRTTDTTPPDTEPDTAPVAAREAETPAPGPSDRIATAPEALLEGPSRRPAARPDGLLGAGSSRTPHGSEDALPLPEVREPPDPADSRPEARGDRGRDGEGADAAGPDRDAPREAPDRGDAAPVLPLPALPGAAPADEGEERLPRISADAYPPGGLLGLLEMEPIDFSEMERVARTSRQREVPQPEERQRPAARTPEPSGAGEGGRTARVPDAQSPARPEARDAGAAREPAAPAGQAGASREPAPPGGEVGTPRAEPAPAPETAVRDSEPARQTPARPPRTAPAAQTPDRERRPGGRAQPAAAGPVDGRRTVTVGDEVRLRLEDGGWVFLGEDGGREGLSFRRRFREDGDTVFIFSADAAGDYVARFQRQDLERGVFRERRFAVDARPQPASGGGAAAEAVRAAEADEDHTPGAGETADDATIAQAPAADLETAYALLEEGRREEALEAFLRSYPVGDADVHDTIAGLAFDLGRLETARSHWTRNLGGEGPHAARARMGLFRTGLAAGNADEAWEHFAALEEEMTGGEGTGDAAAGPTADELLELGTLLMESEEPARAVQPLEAYMELGGTPEDPAALYYNLGRLHEEQRNARGALEYYRRVVDDYPLSGYWQPAEERMQYLRRHFFDIR